MYVIYSIPACIYLAVAWDVKMSFATVAWDVKMSTPILGTRHPVWLLVVHLNGGKPLDSPSTTLYTTYITSRG